MLDKSLLIQELNRISDQLFIDDKPAYQLAQKIWKKICADPLFIHKVKQVDAPWPVPTWDDQLCRSIPVAIPEKDYSVVSVDGSQIYPDRHQGVSCYLINIGKVAFRYGADNPVTLSCVPYVFTDGEEDLQVSTQLVNSKRQELELLAGAESVTDNDLLLFDGSLIFWHLEAQDPLLKQTFLPKYLASLFMLYQKRILTASYISAPRSRELVNLIRLELCDFDTNNTEACKPIERLVDAIIGSFFIPEYHRSIVFKNHSKISEQYPDAVSPYFFYMNIGSEIGRVEIPAWIALDNAKTDHVASIILDQCIKGRGYPVAIAEAHEQAVVKGPDREFFYHVLTKMGIERERHTNLSQKVIKKRGPTL